MENFIALDSIKVATPCRADWEKMQGDDRARFCQSCRKNVYTLSSMTREEAENLIREKEGNLCVRFYQRADGTMISGDCPVGKSVQRRPFYGLLAGFAALMAGGAAVFGGAKTPEAPMQTPNATSNWPQTLDDWRQVRFVGAIVNRFSPQPMITMGDVAMAPTQAAPVLGKMVCPTPKPTPKKK